MREEVWGSEDIVPRILNLGTRWRNKKNCKYEMGRDGLLRVHNKVVIPSLRFGSET
jgi:hypothetical protein